MGGDGGDSLGVRRREPDVITDLVTVHESMVTSVQNRMEPRKSLLGASVDVTDAGFKRSKTAALRVQTLPPDIAITSVPIQVMS